VRRGERIAGAFLLTFLALGLASLPAGTLGAEAGVLRVVAFGDEEGRCARWNERLAVPGPCEPVPYRPGPAACPRGENARRPKLLAYLRDQGDAVHAVLNAGDFVRFDRDVDANAAALGRLRDRFFPTTGGEQEFLSGRLLDIAGRHSAAECEGTEGDRLLDIAVTPGAIGLRACLIDAPPDASAMDGVAWDRRR
jgi:hypothetical protein